MKGMQLVNDHLPDIDFKYLRTFLALAQFGNFSETGRQVGLSQPAVSRHVRAVEDALGLRLFERLGRRAVLTSAGEALRTRLATLMREAESLPRVIRDLADGVHGGRANRRDDHSGQRDTAANPR
jgi:DNA-binding transcriptional LysR family regulator